MQPLENVKFLLVDDVEENLLALEALLRRDGLEMFKARSGRQALEMLLVHDFALAIFDVQMPEMDGFELAEVMRSTERTCKVPIIFLTAVATDERRRFRGYEAGAVDYLLKPVDPQMLRNKAEIFFELARQRQELARQRDELSRSAERLAGTLSLLQAHTDNSPLAIVAFDSDLRLGSWSKGAERMFGWNEEQMLGQLVKESGWLHEEDATRLGAVAAELLDRSGPANVFPCRNYTREGNVIESEWYISAVADSRGKLVSINAQILDVTERKRAEATQQLLIGELNHRVKNTLATVQAIATQTLRHAKCPSDFAASFSGRLQSLAHAHSLLSDANWRGANLIKLVRDQQNLRAIEEGRFIVSGPEVHLPPQLALHLGLILHELTTNAQKHGALAFPQGYIELSWVLDGEVLRLNWVEAGSVLAEEPTKRGFGSSLIERSACAEGGTAQMSINPDGISWELSFAISQQNAYRTATHSKSSVKGLERRYIRAEAEPAAD
ncbi:HWE histidine kinase domain-containing protein [Chelativorans sp. Marseille-P2723]|uniref:sensor histidine kinase n=1 Tax=Chelativorans sp. Marseille-P2723 TaxID=2709133 RepID=UPI00156D820D|nr:HWE histidine kinase domain-containing protein [Chelativorans sp. Marseille-P2723]